MKVALITGITGQDGSYLAELLLKKNSTVFGLTEEKSHKNLSNISQIQRKLSLIHGNLQNYKTLIEAVKKAKPNEVYNLAAQSSPALAIKKPFLTADVTALGAHRLLEAVRNFAPKAKFFQASSGQMFGNAKSIPQNEKTLFKPENPYAVSKLYAHNMVFLYRNDYKLFASTAILYNHESARRTLNFVTQKVCYAAACARLNIKNSKALNEEGEPIVKSGKVALGNLKSEKDWGYAKDYVKAMWLILQQEEPDDFVIGTGKLHSIEDLCRIAYSHLNLNWKDYVEVDRRFVRPLDKTKMAADFSKAKRVLGWKPEVSFKKMIEVMVDENIKKLKKE